MVSERGLLSGSGQGRAIALVEPVVEPVALTYCSPQNVGVQKEALNSIQ